MYGNLKGLSMCKGDKVSWHLSGLGSETDIHGLYFEGNRFLYQDTRRDTINVFPHISHTVIMEPDSMGTVQSLLSLTSLCRRTIMCYIETLDKYPTNVVPTCMHFFLLQNTKDDNQL